MGSDHGLLVVSFPGYILGAFLYSYPRHPVGLFRVSPLGDLVDPKHGSYMGPLYVLLDSLILWVLLLFLYGTYHGPTFGPLLGLKMGDSLGSSSGTYLGTSMRGIGLSTLKLSCVVFLRATFTFH